MSDKTFESSLTAVVVVAVLWIVAGMVLGLLGTAWVVIIGIIIALAGGGVLLQYWGKDYMARR